MSTNVVLFQLVGTNLSLTNLAGSDASTQISYTNEIVRAWGPVVIGFLAIVAGFVTQYFLIAHQRKQADRQNELTRKQLEVARSKEEREEIHRKLNTFYGPFKELRTQSRILNRKFALEHRQAAKQNGQRFRTLHHLLEGKVFTGQDAELLTQILQISQQIKKLIDEQSGVVDKPELQELLGKLAAHIRILQLASEGKLSGPPKAFDDIVFPLAVDGAIESAVLRLQDKLRQLHRMGADQSTSASETDIHRSTIKYYDDNAERYARQTLFVDMGQHYLRFLNLLPPWARILDAGCGAGRDTRHFIETGNVVISFDASNEMVRKCNEYPHAYCTQSTFDQIDFKEEFDGVWACASLLHLPIDDARHAVARLTTALRPGGVLFISVKKGTGTRIPDGRYFQYYDESSLEDLYKGDARLECVEKGESSATGTDGCETIVWLNVFLRRRFHG